MRKIYRWLQHGLGFSQRETNGFLVLSALMLLAILLLFWLPALFPVTPYDSSADKRQLDSLAALLDTTTAPVEGGSPRKYSDMRPAVPQMLFAFDPNTLSEAQWRQLGLPRFLAQRILRYLGKGGRFRTKSDLQRIYDFPEPLYRQLHPYIQLPERLAATDRPGYPPRYPDDSKKPFSERTYAKPARFDLNLADSSHLIAVRGIGPGLSRRILRYRDALGGFSSETQVREVYGLDSAVVDELFKYAFLTPRESIRKLRINTATVAELDAHPYISPRLAKVIVAYRTQHGPYRDAAALAPVKILDAATLQKIAPYLSFE